MRVIRLLILGASLALFFVYGALSDRVSALRDLEFLVRDAQTQIRADSKPDHKIVVIDIDEYSLQRLGSWPWSRQQIAALVDQLLEQHQVQIVGLDVVLPEPRDAAGDQRLARLGAEQRLVFSEVLDYADRTDPSRTGSLSAGQHTHAEDGAPQAKGFVANHALLSQSPCIGNIGFVPDADGKLRSIPLISGFQGRAYPTLSLAILDCMRAERNQRFSTPRLALEYSRSDQSWLVIPASAILQPTLEEQMLLGQITPSLEGRIALIGSSALGLSDRVSTPLSPSVSGVFVHAHALSQLLQAQPERPVPSWGSAAYMSAGVGSLLALFLALTSRSRSTRIRLVFGTMWVLLGAVCVQYANPQVPMPVTAIPVSSLLLLLTLGSYEWARERGLARSSVQLLERYVSDTVLKSLLKTRNFDALRPRHTQITVLVVDLAGYSARVSALSLEDSTAFTRQILEIMTRPVLAHGGTLDRYTGDGLVAFWGAPLSDPYAADHAVKAALEIQTAIEQEVGCQVRCGLASGEALVGDVGSTHRAHYTAVGNCINLAARLEALAKALGVQVLMDEATAQGLLSHKASALETREIRGVGPVNLFTVTSRLAP